ncbi:MAG: hypothetical protein RCO49_07030 [Rickettsia endosymbiont of Argas persicus]
MKKIFQFGKELYQFANDEFLKKEIDNKIFGQVLTDTEIATGLTKFVNEHQGKLRLNSKFSNLFPNATSLAKIEPAQAKNIDLVALRKIDPVAFDKAMVKNSGLIQSQKKTQVKEITAPKTPSIIPSSAGTKLINSRLSKKEGSAARGL